VYSKGILLVILLSGVLLAVMIFVVCNFSFAARLPGYAQHAHIVGAVEHLLMLSTSQSLVLMHRVNDVARVLPLLFGWICAIDVFTMNVSMMPVYHCHSV